MLKPFEWQDKPALIEHLFPVQKISAESFKEQSAVQSKMLTALGSYWKGRKPLTLNKACILGTLLPATDNPLKDLEVFELLMGMDTQSMEKRLAASLPNSKIDQVGEYLVLPYNEQVRQAKRPEELSETLFSHAWNKVNAHLGTSAISFLSWLNKWVLPALVIDQESLMFLVVVVKFLLKPLVWVVMFMLQILIPLLVC